MATIAVFCCSASLLIWIAAAVTIVCTFSPFWFEATIELFMFKMKMARGLFMSCSSEPGEGCGFIIWSELDEDNRWIVSSGVSWIAGIILILLCSFSSCGLCCCRKAWSATLAGFTGIAGVVLMIAATIFGVNINKDMDELESVGFETKFGWTFYIVILDIILLFVTMILFGLSFREAKKASVVQSS